MRATTVLAFALLFAGCKKTPVVEDEDKSQTDPTVKPVYPLEHVEPHPLASKLCRALHGVPVERKAACCKEAPGVLLTQECTRNLSGALNAKAVLLSEKDVDGCARAIDSAYQGCDWVGPWNAPAPAACMGIMHGTLDARSQCRSSLECKEGLRCLGVGPTDVGVCGPPPPSGKLCNSAVDTLAVYVRQDQYEEAHPACAGGYCDRNRCEPIQPAGGACKSNPQCGPSARCKDGVCTAGRSAKDGEACLGGECEGGMRCVGGICAAPKAIGSTCTQDGECKAACVEGKCAPSCAPFGSNLKLAPKPK
jgi:hypothetical protein